MARRGRSRRRRRGSGGIWILVVPIGLVAVPAMIRFVTTNAVVILIVVALLLAGLCGVLYLRHRMIEAERRRFLAANLELAKVDQLTGDQFERLIVERLRADGFRQVNKRGGSGDLGVDITALAPGHGRYAFQCKRYRNTVGAPEVRNFLGALANAFVGCTGVLVTSGRLTRQAKAEALAARQPLIVIERDQLADWLLGTVTLLPSSPPDLLVEGEPA
ncbi:restriction endonuclease [Nonomuraea sp. NPDC050536]|uniref:restriction endonuclease n=1 Tax=Nonomuraea sp. NPDC050536 TaxID=3364366 RepID=UPI0037CCB6FF